MGNKSDLKKEIGTCKLSYYRGTWNDKRDVEFHEEDVDQHGRLANLNRDVEQCLSNGTVTKM